MIRRRGTAAATRDGKRPGGAAAGFTLLELLVVLAVLGLSLVLVVGYKPPWSRSLGMAGSVRELAAALRGARAAAISENRPVVVDIDLAKRAFRVGDAPVHLLPPRLTLSLLTVAGERHDRHTGGILFNPDGSSTGGRIALSDGVGTASIGVDWLTGRIVVADRP